MTGERFTFLETAQDTDGDLLRLDYFMRPHGFVPVEHVHLRQEERFEVLSGTPRFRVAGEERDASPGQKVVIPSETPHVLWNPRDEEIHLIIELRPALRTETVFGTGFGLARDGKTDRKGWPTLLQLAVLAGEYKDELVPANRLLRAASANAGLLAPVGRLFGYRARYERYSGPE